MTCPVCAGETKVIATRDQQDHVLRKRKCMVCGYRFLTVELDIDMLNRTNKEGERHRDKNR